MNTKIPIILITGYLGSGKTTLLNELLKQENRKIALIVNDMGSVNIDANLLKKGNIAQNEYKMVELQNGCICCTLRDEFMKQIEKLSKEQNIEAIFVEASGISEPSAIAQGFLAYEEINPNENIYLNSIMIHVYLFEQAGQNATVDEWSNWIASFDKDEQEKTKEEYPEILEDWNDKYGDRKNQIVFIGQDHT